ncbi:protein ROOT PRIMORDIUM DEFECTIVE 1 [Magnolia sinica]|uniref:protein ROOT PRIMORDIUM DEFECTIVE 1 n=1 Tax=Magnolia sinica TaxID=86752 RepID=UPI002657EAFA|nr:protein ROOT PRIMORDIUM DEFECTIVE 1 [Magnolia sinica]
MPSILQLYSKYRASSIHLSHPSITSIHLRLFSQSTSLPKKVQRVRDHGFDGYMEIHKKIIKTVKFQSLILSQPDRTLCVARLDSLGRRLGLKQYEAGSFILKYPHVFDIYEHPVQRILWCRLTRSALLQIDVENRALQSQLPDAVIRLRKLIMLSNTSRLRLEHIRIARHDLGLPDDFEFSVVLANPNYFRLFEDKDPRSKFVEIVERDPDLAVCSMERKREREYRERGLDAEDIRFSFIINFPPGFKIGKYYKIAVWKWQRLPYWSPYEDVSGYDLRSIEAKKRMEKRAVATIHEILSLTVEKKMTLERIAHFRLAMDLPKKLKEFLLQHQGIFYISTRGNHGKLHTVFLREAYRKGELVEPNELYLARRKLAELILRSPRKANLDPLLVHFRGVGEGDGEAGSAGKDYGEDQSGNDGMRSDGEGREDSYSDSALGSDSDFDSKLIESGGSNCDRTDEYGRIGDE